MRQQEAPQLPQSSAMSPKRATVDQVYAPQIHVNIDIGIQIKWGELARYLELNTSPLVQSCLGSREGICTYMKAKNEPRGKHVLY